MSCYPDLEINDFQTEVDWTEFYGDVTEPIPMNEPVARGKAVDIRLYVDADFAGDKFNRRSE